MLALVKKVIDFLKYVTNRDLNGVLTTAGAWIGGIVVIVLFAQSNFAEGIKIGDTTLAAINFASLVVVGMSIGSGAGLANDWISAKEPKDDPARLKLLPSATRSAARRRIRGEDGHIDWQTALLAAAVSVVVWLIMWKLLIP